MRPGPVLLGLWMLVLLPSSGWAGSPSPAGLVAVFADFLDLEEDIECQSWPTALARSARIEATLRTVERSRDRRQAAVAAAFRPRLGILEQALRSGSATTGYRVFFQLREEFLELLAAGSCRLSALLAALDRDLEAARAGAADNDWKEVVHELREIEFLYLAAVAELHARGVPDELSRSFLELLRSLRRTLEAEEFAPLDELLRELTLDLQLQRAIVLGS